MARPYLLCDYSSRRTDILKHRRLAHLRPAGLVFDMSASGDLLFWRFRRQYLAY
jgi:hypothetical protein